MLPPIPENTIRAALASYGKGNIYLRLGDQINQLISRLDSELLTLRPGGYTGTLLAAITLIQHVEHLTDQELTKSLPRRVDLRYALHLPTPGPRFDPSTLCAFRQKVLGKQKYHLLVEETFKVLHPMLQPQDVANHLDIYAVVKSICLNTIRMSVVEAVFHAMEALSANHFTWLRQIALPHWYERYSPSLLMLDAGLSIKQKEYTPDDLRIDIEYLLNAAGQANNQKINDLPEIKALRRMWEELLHIKAEDRCTYCFKNRFERRSVSNSTNKNPAR